MVVMQKIQNHAGVHVSCQASSNRDDVHTPSRLFFCLTTGALTPFLFDRSKA